MIMLFESLDAIFPELDYFNLNCEKIVPSFILEHDFSEYLQINATEENQYGYFSQLFYSTFLENIPGKLLPQSFRH